MGILYESHKTKIELLPQTGNTIQCVRKVVKGNFSKLICRREVKALKELKGIKGVQQIIEQDSDVSFISEYVRGVSVKRSSQIDLSGILSLVSGTLNDVHSALVCDLDFGNKKDWLINSDGNPVLIDFAASIIPGDIFHEKLFRLGCTINYGSLLEFKEGLSGSEGLTHEERQKLLKYKNTKMLFRRIRLK